MEKRYLIDLTKEELEKVLAENEGLQRDISERTVESESIFLDDQLSYLKNSLSDYSICPYSPSYLNIIEPLDFLRDMLELEKSMPVLNVDDEVYLNKALEEADKLEELEDVTEEDFLKFEDAVLELRDVVLNKMIEQLEYGYSYEAIKNFFYEVYIYEENNLYVEGDSFELKEDITISYKK